MNSTNPATKAASSGNFLALLALLMQSAPQFEALFAALLAAFGGTTPAVAIEKIRRVGATAKQVGAVITTPTSVDDILSINDTYVALSTFLSAEGITDPGILGAVDKATATNLQNGATAVLAFATSNPGDGAPLVFSHDGVNYEVNPTSTPPIIVLSTVLEASAIPYPAPTP